MEEQKISPSQLMTLVFVSVFSFVILNPSSGGISLTATVAAVIVGAALILLMALPLTGSSILSAESSTAFSAKVITILYGMFFVYAFSMGIYMLCGFVDEIAGDDINKYIIAAALAAGSLFAASRGIEAAARFSLLTLVIVIISAVIFTYYTYSSFDPSVFAGFRVSADTEMPTRVFSLFAFLPPLAAIMFYGKNTTPRPGKKILLPIIAGGIFILYILILICGTSGEYLTGVNYPFFRAIDAAGELQRFDPVFIAVTVCCTFCSLSLDLTAAGDSLRRAFPGRKYGLTLTVIAALAALSGILAYNSRIGMLIFAAPAAAALTIVFFFLIPLLVSALSLIKHDPGKWAGRIKKSAVGMMCITILVATLCGCNSVQLSQKLIVQGLSIDKTDSGYFVSCIILDTENEKGDNEVKYVSCEGGSIEGALGSLEASTGNRVMLSQCLFILMSDSAADKAADTLRYFADNKEIMKNVSLLISDTGAASLLKKAVMKLGYTCEEINMLTSSRAVLSHPEGYTLFDYISDRNSGKTAYAIPRIRLNKQTEMLEAY